MKLAKLHAKNNFAFAILAGNIFADPDRATDSEKLDAAKLLSGDIEVPCPTYFALGSRALPAAVSQRLKSNQGEVCPNLSILSMSFKTSEGFKIVAVGGVHADVSEDATDPYSATYTDQYVGSAKEFKEADLLITSDWPADVRTGSRALYAGESPMGISSISELCASIKPRYHFTTSDAIYEREPYFHPGPPPRPVTRFLSLAPLNNAQKHKAMYAFSLEPSATPPERMPEGCTALPFAGSKKRKLDSQQDSYNQFRYGNGNSNVRPYEERDYRGGKRRRNDPKRSECYFCLSGNDHGTHMITSIGEDVYMTVAKGPLSTKQTFPGLNHPMNMLIIPLTHAPTSAAIPDLEIRQKTIAEMKRYRDSLHSMIASKSTKGADGEAQLGAVTWEISRSSGVHLHWQFLPVPVDMIKRGLIEAAFDVEAENLKYPKFAKTEAKVAEAEEGDYFKAMIWSESVQKDIVMPLDKGLRFDLQFGRRVLGKLFKLEDRIHWKDCQQTEQEESADADAFKEMFEQYDFSLHEE